MELWLWCGVPRSPQPMHRSADAHRHRRHPPSHSLRSAVFGSSVCGPKLSLGCQHFVTMGGGKGKGDKGAAGTGKGKGTGKKGGKGKEVRTVTWWAPRKRLGD